MIVASCVMSWISYLNRNNRRKIVTWVHFQLGSCYVFYKILILVSSFNIGDHIWTTYAFPDIFDYIFLSIILLTWTEATLMLKTFVVDVWGTTTWKFLCITSAISWGMHTILNYINCDVNMRVFHSHISFVIALPLLFIIPREVYLHLNLPTT